MVHPSVQSCMKSMGTIWSSHKYLYRDFLSTRPTRLGEPPPVSLLFWSRGGLVIVWSLSRKCGSEVMSADTALIKWSFLFNCLMSLTHHKSSCLLLCTKLYNNLALIMILFTCLVPSSCDIDQSNRKRVSCIPCGKQKMCASRWRI